MAKKPVVNKDKETIANLKMIIDKQHKDYDVKSKVYSSLLKTHHELLNAHQTLKSNYEGLDYAYQNLKTNFNKIVKDHNGIEDLLDAMSIPRNDQQNEFSFNLAQRFAIYIAQKSRENSHD